jgi:hypothetical protein
VACKRGEGEGRCSGLIVDYAGDQAEIFFYAGKCKGRFHLRSDVEGRGGWSATSQARAENRLSIIISNVMRASKTEEAHVRERVQGTRQCQKKLGGKGALVRAAKVCNRVGQRRKRRSSREVIGITR